MNYNQFIGLRTHEQAYHTLSFGTYVGTNAEGDDIYQLYDFWVTVQENTKGFYYEAVKNRPVGMINKEVLGAQEL